ncbi:MAG TPA: ferrous iron transporter B, partial [Anaerolineales bacterium]|nr:ferrous iron transporter B [Anaerolineales bacterium]
QLIEAGLPVILVGNLMDEAERIGVQVDLAALESALGIPVVGTALVSGRGTAELKELLGDCLDGTSSGYLGASDFKVPYHPRVEEAIKRIEDLLEGNYQISKRAVALLLLQNDASVTALVQQIDEERLEQIKGITRSVQEGFNQPLSYLIVREQREAAQRILRNVLAFPEKRRVGFADRLGEAAMNPLTGIPLLALSLFLLYEFVGVFGAQTLVNFLETSFFGVYINPWVDGLLAAFVPWESLRNLIGGEYGVITLGVRYAVAIIFPIVGTFFLAFSIIEDSGYLPRLAMLIDRVFKKIGLNGRAVIPLVLGFGCDTMATIVTRTLETRRERLLSTLLLSLAIPCSAQLGVMLGLLAGNPLLLVWWAIIVAGIFLLVGYLAALLMPGEQPTFYMELPPLRLPSLGNILVKTYTRMEWYFREVFPLFLAASVIIWFGHLTGLFDLVVNAISPVVNLIGLPDKAAVAFLFGFFRRDYGAAGLYDMRDTLSGVQILVATVTLTLFVPCVAQFSVMVKERGWKTALAIAGFIFPFAFLVGGLLNWLLMLLKVQL